MADLVFAVRCVRPIRSARIRDRKVEVEFESFDKLGFRLWTPLPEEQFKLMATNLRDYYDKRQDFHMDDGRNVCKYLRGKKARVRFTGEATGDRIWREAEFMGLVE